MVVAYGGLTLPLNPHLNLPPHLNPPPQPNLPFPTPTPILILPLANHCTEAVEL